MGGNESAFQAVERACSRAHTHSSSSTQSGPSGCRLEGAQSADTTSQSRSPSGSST